MLNFPNKGSLAGLSMVIGTHSHLGSSLLLHVSCLTPARVAEWVSEWKSESVSESVRKGDMEMDGERAGERKKREGGMEVRREGERETRHSKTV
jgi:hypothetical protein